MYIDLKEIKLPESAKIEISPVVNDGLKTVYVYIGENKQVFINQRGSNKRLIAKFEKWLKEVCVLAALKKANVVGAPHSIFK